MHANLAVTERQNAAGNNRSASIAKTLTSHVSMRMANGTGQRSKYFRHAKMLKPMLMSLRQLGSLAGRVEEYERLLKDLSLRAGLQDQDSIRKALDKVNSN